MGSEVTDELIEILKERVTFPRDTIDGLRYALSELIDNVFHHASVASECNCVCPNLSNRTRNRDWLSSIVE